MPEDNDATALYMIAAIYLGEIEDSSAVDPLRAKLSKKDIDEEVIEALGKIGDTGAAEPTIAVLKKHRDNSLKVNSRLQ